MEPLQKRTSTSKDEQIHINDLPDHLVHNILKFLTTEDVSRLSVVSRRCRNLCISVPSIVIDLADMKRTLGKRAEYFNFMDRFMMNRNGLKLASFKLDWEFSKTDHRLYLYNEDYRVDSWLNQVSKSNVETLDLQIRFRELNYYKTFVLPYGFTNCESLNRLKITLHNGILVLPISNSFDFLQHLIIENAIIQENIIKEVLLGCKTLFRFSISHIKGIEFLDIESSTLVILEIFSAIEDLNPSPISKINISACRLKMLYLYWISLGRKKLVIFAPEVVFLKLEGDLQYYDSLRDIRFEKLHATSVFSQTNPSMLIDNGGGDSGQPRCNDEIFQSLREARLMSVNMGFIKVLSAEIFLAISFENLETLHLHVSPDSDGYDVPMVVYFLTESCPNLQSLVLQSYFESAVPVNANQSNSTIEESTNYIDTIATNNLNLPIENLKSVEIELRVGNSHSGLKLVKQLLKQAKTLEKITVYYFPVVYRKVQEIISSVQQFERASPTVSVYVLPRSYKLYSKDKRLFFSPLV
ncbi:F-box/FBD/LRR-repeat protein At1g78750-like [Mercurialis annua]|uniref:F-box/FBD/LRR-repeat protein At1g78750-like n=1 Tax=Mercurialis annua TaxID=3986 RepID=UPI0021608C33|nr:F-box/FBD/LRR-repeat protein At1g78750-like [Mercurialis annua]